MSNCSVCSKMKRKNNPVTWCPECQEALCHNCSQYHQVTRSSEDHVTISYDNFKKLPLFIQKVRPFCKDHGKKYQNFCKQHDKPVCALCLATSHSSCKGTPVLDDVILNVKSSVMFDDVQKSLQGTQKKISLFKRSREENVKKLKKDVSLILKNFEKRIGKLIARLTFLKQTTISEMLSAEEKQVGEISDIIKILQCSEEKLSEMFDQTDSIREYASDFQSFIGMKEMEKSIFELNENLGAMYMNGDLNDVRIEEEDNDLLDEIIMGTEHPTEIMISKTIPAISIDARVTNRAQTMLTPRTPMSARLKLEHRLSTEKDGRYFAGCLLSNGLTAVADCNDKHVEIKNMDGCLKSIVNVSKGINDITAVDVNHFAVSIPEKNKITMYDSTKGVATREIRTVAPATGIAHFNNNIVFCVPGKGIKIIEINKNVTKDIISDVSVDGDSHIAMEMGRICYTSLKTNTVTAIDRNGSIKFRYKDEKVLRGPMGVTMDSYLNTFVAGYHSNNLVAISTNGDVCRELTGCNEIEWPTAVQFVKKYKKLMVVDVNGFILIYSLC